MTAGVTQFDNDLCAGRNCWAATTARLVNFAKGTSYGASYLHKLVTPDCRPGGSADITKGLSARGVGAFTTDFITSTPGTEAFKRDGDRWMADLKDRTANGEAAGLVGDYDALENTAFEVLETFQDDHWVSVDHYDPKTDTFAWADPTRKPNGFAPSRIPAALVRRYWIDLRKPRPGAQALVRGRAVFVRGPEFVEDYMITVDPKQNLLLPEDPPTPYYAAVNDPIPLGKVFVPGDNGVEYGAITRAGWRAIRVGRTDGPTWVFIRTGVGKFVPKPAPTTTGGFTQKQLDDAVTAARAEEAAEAAVALAAALQTNTEDLKARASIATVGAVQEAIAAL